jgi:hypothetical protein
MWHDDYPHRHHAPRRRLKVRRIAAALGGTFPRQKQTVDYVHRKNQVLFFDPEKLSPSV